MCLRITDCSLKDFVQSSDCSEDDDDDDDEDDDEDDYEDDYEDDCEDDYDNENENDECDDNYNDGDSYKNICTFVERMRMYYTKIGCKLQLLSIE